MAAAIGRLKQFSALAFSDSLLRSSVKCKVRNVSGMEVKENMTVEGGGLNNSHSEQLVDFSLEEGPFCGIESVSMTERLTSEPLT